MSKLKEVFNKFVDLLISNVLSIKIKLEKNLIYLRFFISLLLFILFFIFIFYQKNIFILFFLFIFLYYFYKIINILLTNVEFSFDQKLIYLNLLLLLLNFTIILILYYDIYFNLLQFFF